MPCQQRLRLVDLERLTYWQEWVMFNTEWGQLVETYTYRFNYNAADSLTGATRPDGSRITIFYDPKTTKVTSFIDRQGEMESYTVLQGAPDQ
jgi:hypothetical protein